MVPEIRIGSRWGNRLICALGVIYSVAALTLLAYYLFSSWGASGLLDHALQACLGAAVVAGVLFVVIGRYNLRRLGEASR